MSRETLVREACARLGIAISRRGQAYVLEGPGVHLVVSDLAYVRLDDLEPARYAGRREAAKRNERNAR